MSINKIRVVLFVFLIVIILLWIRFWGDETRIVRSAMNESDEIVIMECDTNSLLCEIKDKELIDLFIRRLESRKWKVVQNGRLKVSDRPVDFEINKAKKQYMIDFVFDDENNEKRCVCSIIVYENSPCIFYRLYKDYPLMENSFEERGFSLQDYDRIFYTKNDWEQIINEISINNVK